MKESTLPWGKDIFPASGELLAAQALGDKISSSYVFLFPLISVESLPICADTNSRDVGVPGPRPLVTSWGWATLLWRCKAFGVSMRRPCTHPSLGHRHRKLHPHHGRAGAHSPPALVLEAEPLNIQQAPECRGMWGGTPHSLQMRLLSSEAGKVEGECCGSWPSLSACAGTFSMPV